jgi:hypothetical protein
MASRGINAMRIDRPSPAEEIVREVVRCDAVKTTKPLLTGYGRH